MYQTFDNDYSDPALDNAIRIAQRLNLRGRSVNGVALAARLNQYRLHCYAGKTLAASVWAWATPDSQSLFGIQLLSYAKQNPEDALPDAMAWARLNAEMSLEVEEIYEHDVLIDFLQWEPIEVPQPMTAIAA